MEKSLNFGQNAINYFNNLKTPDDLIPGVGILNPYINQHVKGIIEKFYSTFFKDNNKRIFILGINPGRFGGGITGISFTDPVALREYCGIENDLGTVRETSSRFIYKAIQLYGGAEKFFSSFYLSALYPYALIKESRNYNFYDDKNLYNTLKPELILSLKKQIEFGADDKAVICLGKKNTQFLKELNDEVKYFKEIKTLEHPRYVMQYKMKHLNKYLNEYCSLFNQLAGK